MAKSKCTVKDLLPALLTCRPFASTKTMVPAMQHFLLWKDSIVATNGHVGIVYYPQVPLPEATVPADLFTKIMGSFAEDAVWTIVERDGKVVLTVGKYRGEFPSYPVDDFPKVTIPKKPVPLSEESVKSFRQLAFCMSTDDTRQNMRGVYFDGSGVGHATDNRRIAWRATKQSGLKTILIPAYLLERVLGWGEAPTGYALDPEGKFWLFFSDKSVFSVLPEGAFPDTAKVIKAHEAQAKTWPQFSCERGVLQAALQRLLFSVEDDPSKPIRLQLSPTSLRLESTPTGTQTGAGRMVEEVPVKTVRVKGTPITALVNGDYFREAVGFFDEFLLGDTILAGFGEGRKFGVFISLLTG